MKRVYKDKPKPEKIKKTVRVWVPPIKTSSGVRFGYWTNKEVEGDARTLRCGKARQRREK